MNCYCCSGKTFEACCKRLIAGEAKAATAEELMRSRYSAYAAVRVAYLMKTTHPSVRAAHNAKEIERWAKSCSWNGLEIVSTEMGGAADIIGTVEFKAMYQDLSGRRLVHHESSKFVKDGGQWFFVTGVVAD